MKRAVAVLALLAPTIAMLSACTGIPFVERICTPDKVVVEPGANGADYDCEEPEPDDPSCPDLEILLKDEKSGVEECVSNNYDDYYNDRLSSQTPTT